MREYCIVIVSHWHIPLHFPSIAFDKRKISTPSIVLDEKPPKKKNRMWIFVLRWDLNSHCNTQRVRKSTCGREREREITIHLNIHAHTHTSTFIYCWVCAVDCNRTYTRTPTSQSKHTQCDTTHINKYSLLHHFDSIRFAKQFKILISLNNVLPYFS